MARPKSGNGGESRAVRRGRDLHVNVILLANRALDAIDELCQEEGLTHSQYVALWTLCLTPDAPTGIPIGAVTDGLLTRASDATRLIDRLQAAGLAERLPNPADRRGVLVRATALGRARFEALTPRIQAFHAAQWTGLTTDEQAQLARLLAQALYGTGGAPK